MARPGMELAVPVYHPARAERVLLRAGFKLDKKVIGRLLEIGAPEIWIVYPPFDFVREQINPELATANAELTRSVGRAFDEVTREAYGRLDYPSYRRAVVTMLEKLMGSPSAAVFVHEIQCRDAPSLRHASSVSFLSLLIGLKLEDYIITQRKRLAATQARDLTSLGLGALLHDIGMLRLDPETLNRWITQHDESDTEWRRHVLLGYEIVKGSIDPSAAAIVLHHHQRFDGKGFPSLPKLGGEHEPQRGEAIHIFARIVAAADLFDRLRHGYADPTETQDGPPKSIARSLKRMRDDAVGRRLDPMVFKALLAVVPPYPPGSLVTLSTGAQAVVTDWFADDPCRPVVRVLPDRFDPCEPIDDVDSLERISLRETPGVLVSRIGDEDVEEDNFFPNTPGEFDLALAGRALFTRVDLDDEAEPPRAQAAG